MQIYLEFCEEYIALSIFMALWKILNLCCQIEIVYRSSITTQDKIKTDHVMLLSVLAVLGPLTTCCL